MHRSTIIHAIEECQRTTGLAPATISSRGAGNSRLYDRLKAGGECKERVALRVLAYCARVTADRASEARPAKRRKVATQ